MSTLLDEIMLIKVDTKANNNKFYQIQLFDSEDVVVRWGRVGNDGQSKTYRGIGQHGFDSLVREKNRRGYKQTKVVSLASQKHVSNDILKRSAMKNLTGSDDPVILDLIERLVALNQHNLVEKSGGLISVNMNGQITTPLGLIDKRALQEAEDILQKLNSRAFKGKREHLLEEYLTLVPQKVKSGWQTLFLARAEDIVEQKNLIDQLRDSLDWYETNKKALQEADSESSEVEVAFRMRLSSISHKSPEFKHIEKFYNRTRNRVHSYSYNMKLVNVYAIEDTVGLEQFQQAQKSYGNTRELWHGTGAANVLSILTKGFFVPKHGDGIAITGRMFGSGVYFSDQSTKSLNYATGYWNGNRSSRNSFMFLNDVVMGHEFRPKFWNAESLNKAHKGKGRISGKPFHSINVQGGTCGVVNNEMIVWDTDQINIKYLCEFAS